MIKEDLRNHEVEEVEKILERNKGVKTLILPHGKLVITTLRNKKIIQFLKKFHEDLTNVNSEDLPDMEDYEKENALSALTNKQTTRARWPSSRKARGR
ncbi:hypothetical protein HHI36_022360 [Cryptolaemus montrouzieri]|uniref:Uncharacterized protein n=1 Tax=Cryptolaemus montrouzieri TaxID=559131 RepID=A0ABD2MZK5_9CUCU